MINLAYNDRGKGDPVLFIAGRGGPGRTWDLHQVPAFLGAGYRVITFDNRGIGATENESQFTLQTMIDDTVALIEGLRLTSLRIVGVSMGAFVAAEMLLKRPDLATQVVLMATRGRFDRTREFFQQAERERLALKLPANFDAKVRLLESLSAKTLNDDAAVRDWIDMFAMFPMRVTPGLQAQWEVSPQTNRLPAYRGIKTPTLVVGFADDVVTPPYLGKEVADAIPRARYVEIRDAGHVGFMERPQEVNAAILKFFADTAPPVMF